MATPIVTPPVPEKVEFTEAQQAHIQRLFDARFSTIAKKKDEELKPLQDENAELKRQIEALKIVQPVPEHKVVTPPVADAEREQTLQLLRNEQQQTAAAKAAFDREKQRADGIEAANAEMLKNMAIRDAASHLENGLEFHDLPMVIELVRNSIVLDKDSGEYVVKVGGVVKKNSSLMNMSLTEYFMEYAAARPYLVKSQVKGGAGSKESGNGGGGQEQVGLIRSKADLTVGGNPTSMGSVKLRSAYITKFGVEKYNALPLK